MLTTQVSLLPLLGPDLVLPDGFVVPPWEYFVALVVLLVGVVALLWALRPQVTDWTPLAIAPWIVMGGILHALFQAGAFAREGVPPIGPLVESPAVYATTAIIAGILWIVSTVQAAMSDGSSDRLLGVTGTGFAVTIGTLGVFDAFYNDPLTLDPLWPTIIIFGAALLSALAWVSVSLVFTEAAAYTRKTGALVVFGHVLDGLSTAIGYAVLDVQERTPLSRAVIWAGEQVVASPVAGGVLFFLVKLLLAIGIVVLFRDWIREEPQQARMVLVFIAAVGLGPGIHNVYLFAVGGIA